MGVSKLLEARARGCPPKSTSSMHLQGGPNNGIHFPFWVSPRKPISAIKCQLLDAGNKII